MKDALKPNGFLLVQLGILVVPQQRIFLGDAVAGLGNSGGILFAGRDERLKSVGRN